MKNPILFLGTVLFFSASQMAIAEEETPMTKEMSAANKALKQLRKIEKSDWAGMAKAARESHESFLKSMSYIAKMVEDMQDGPEKVKALADSRRLMGLAYAALCDLELAYLEKDQAKVDAAISKYKELKKEGHQRYTDD